MKGGNNPLKLYLLDANEQIIDAPPTKDVLSLIQDLKLKDTDTVEGALVVSKRYTSIMDNVRYIAVSDRDNDHAFYLYRKTMAEVQDRELIFDGKESFWDDLAGSYIKDKRPGAMLAPDLVKLILAGTRWNVDFVDSGFTETLNTNFYYQSRSDALSNVMSAMTIDIVPMINIEGNTITRRYVNLYLQAGGDNGRRFVYGKNALSVVKKTDDSQVFTALVGRGKSIEQTSTDAETGDTSTYNTPKINFANIAWSKAAGDPVDKPKGQEYVEWPEATKLYGYSNGDPRIGIIEFADDDDPEQLLKDTWDQLQTVGVPSVQFSATVGDVGYLAKGETVTIVNYVKGIAYKTRVTELKWNRLAEAKSQLTIGDKLVQNANERMTAIVASQSSALQAVSERMNKQVANLATIVNESGQNVSYSKDGTMPTNPKENDLAFVRDDDGSVSMKQYVDGKWIILVDDTTGQQIANKVDAKMEQLNADMSAADTNLQAAQQDIDDLQIKLKANDDTQAQLSKDLAVNSNLITQNKTDVDAALDTVNQTLSKAQTDAAQAVIDADQAAANAKSSADASGLSATSAQAANDAATAAKQLATEVSNNFATVQSQAATAASDAADAISAANKAQGDATSALGNSTTAISNAKDALNKINSMSIGGTNLIIQSDLKPGYLDRNVGLANSFGSDDFKSDNYIATNGATVFTFSSPDYVFKGSGNHTLAMYDSDKNYLGYQSITSPTQTLNKSNVAYIRFSINFTHEGGTVGNLSDWLSNHRYKLEKGSLATDWSPSPEDVQIQIDKVNGELSQKVSQTTYNTLASQVTDNTSQLKLTATAASLEVTSKKVDTLSQTVTDQGAKLDLTATSAQLKVTEDKVDALNQTVSDNSAQLKLTATSAALETQSQRVDTISGQVDTNTASITAANGEIELKASNSRVDTLSNTVEQQGIDLKAAQGELKLKLTQSDLTKGLDGYATQTWAQNQITATATELNSTITTVKTQVQNSAVGTNLIIQSDLKPGYLDRNVGLANSFGSDDFKSDNYIATNGATVFTFSSPDYVFKGSGNHTLAMYDSDKNYLGYQSITSPTQTLNKSNVAYIRFSINFTHEGGTVGNLSDWLSNHRYKLEKGSVATDYSVNPADNASATALSKLSQTVDGFSGTFAKQTDLEKATSDFKLTSDGLNLITAVTGTKGEKVTQVIADVNNIKTTMTGANGYTTRLQTLEGFQQTATNSISGLQSTQTQLADTIINSVGSANLVMNSELTSDNSFWYPNAAGADFYRTWVSASTYQGSTAFGISRTGLTAKTYAFNYSVPVAASEGVTVSAGVMIKLVNDVPMTNTDYDYAGVGVRFLDADKQQLDGVINVTKNATVSDWGEAWKQLKIEGDVAPAGTKYVQMYIQAVGNGHILFSRPQLSKTSTLPAYLPGSVDAAQLTIMQNAIDLRTTVAGKVTAALNLSNDGGGTVTIRGASLYVTAASHFDDASINSAAIASLDATKITSGSISADRLATTKLNADNITSGSIAAERIATTALSATNITSGTLDVGKLTVKNLSADLIASGTIDASKITVKNLSASNIVGGELDALLVNVKNIDATNIITGTLNAGLLNVIGLNAASITTGTITGANLAINLNTGQVVFQSGRIHSTTNNIDINVDSGYMSVADSTSRVLLKGGQLQFIQPQLFDLQTTPYLSISNEGSGSNWAGATIVGRDSVIIANSKNIGSGILTWQLGQNDFAGLMVGKNSNGNYEPTLIGGAKRGVIIVGGVATDAGSTVSYTPRLVVGANTDGSGAGTRVFVDASTFTAPCIYNTTGSTSANVYVTGAGTLQRTTSATKYKTSIERSRSTAMAEALLKLPTAKWLDKAEMARYASGEQTIAPKFNFGMIAEDLAAAGLEDLVARGMDGQLEGINYDRIAPALLPLLAKMKQEIEELKGEK